MSYKMFSIKVDRVKVCINSDHNYIRINLTICGPVDITTTSYDTAGETKRLVHAIRVLTAAANRLEFPKEDRIFAAISNNIKEDARLTYITKFFEDRNYTISDLVSTEIVDWS